MRKALRVLVAITAVALLAAGCGRSPKKVFADLQTAGVKKDPKALWADLSPETRAVLVRRSNELYTNAGAQASAYVPTEEDGKKYLSMLTSNLEPLAVEYIRSLRIATVTVKGDTAEVTLGSLRFGAPDKPILMKKVDGKWTWDAREVLEWYLENRSYLSSMAQGVL